MSQVCAERIIQARELKGWTKTELANKLLVSPAAVSQWESGTKHPLPDHVHKLADCLGVPMGFFFREVPVSSRTKGPLTFRSWTSARTRRANQQARRLAEMVAEVYEWIDTLVELPPAQIPEIDHSTSIDTQEMMSIAQNCRRGWGLGDRPIAKLGDLLESKGVIVVHTSFGDDRFDAFSCIINGRPFIFLGDEKRDRARSRFDAAHELGHLLLHQHLTDEELSKKEVLTQVEREANRFAGCFLMPPDSFIKDVYDVSLRGYLNLKHKWGTSAKAMVTHSRHFDHRVSDATATEIHRQMSARGMNKAKGEPFDDVIPTIKGTLGRKAIDMIKEAGLRQSWEIPHELPLPKVALCIAFGMKPEELDSPDTGHGAKIIELRSVRAA